MSIPSTWTCSCCGKVHTGLPLDFAVMFPDYYADWREGLSEEQIKERSFFTEDVCTVEDEYYFVRGVIQLPLIGFPAERVQEIAAALLHKSEP